MTEKTIYKSEIQTIYFKAQDIYYRTEYFQFNLKSNKIHDRREFFYETLKDLDLDVQEYYEKTNLLSKFYNFLPFIKSSVYEYVSNVLLRNHWSGFDPLSEKFLFNALMRIYFDMLLFINNYKYDNPDWSFEDISKEDFFDIKQITS